MVSIDPATGTIVWNHYSISPFLTLSAFEKEIADSSQEESKPKFLPHIIEQSPFRNSPFEKQQDIDAERDTYWEYRLTLKEYELPIIRIQTEPRDYNIGGFLLFQNDEARQLRLQVQFPDENLHWETASIQQEFAQNKLCQQILETHLG